MKKLVTTVLSFILVVTLQAQTNYLSNLYFGVNGSTTLSNIYPEHNYGSGDLYNPQATLGYAGGMTIGFTVNDVHSFQIDINYSKQGQNFEDVHRPNPSVLKKEIDLAYLKAPLTYRYTRYIDAYSSSSPSIYFEGGIYTAQLQSGSLSYTWADTAVTFEVATDPGNNFSPTTPLESKEFFTPYDFGLVLGVGVEVPLANDLSLMIGSRSEIGLTDINALRYRLPIADRGYRPSLNIVTGLRVGLVYNLYQ